jgi:hypothetical protein
VGYLNDLWEYDAGSNSWTQKANFPGAPRYECVSFAIGEFGYIGCGAYAGTLYDDFYEYQPQNDLWIRRADYPGTGCDAAAGFALEGRGFIGTGSTQGSYPVDFYEWNQYNDVWTAKANFPAAGRAFGTGFSILDKGYIGLGEAAGYFQDWWEYTPDSLLNSIEHHTLESPEVFISGTSISLLHADNFTAPALISLYDARGRRIFALVMEQCKATFQKELPAGVYIYSVQSGRGTFSGKVFIAR